MPNFQIELFPDFQAMHGMDRAKQYCFEIRMCLFLDLVITVVKYENYNLQGVLNY